jgi:hypothetical protein
VSVKLLTSPGPFGRECQVASAAIFAVSATLDESLLFQFFHQSRDGRRVDPKLTSDFQDPDTGRRGVGKFAHQKKPRSRHAHHPAETIDEHLIGPYDLLHEMPLFAGGVEAISERDSRGRHMTIMD